MSNSERHTPDRENYNNDGGKQPEGQTEFETARDQAATAVNAERKSSGRQAVAPAWHTAVLVVVLLVIALLGARSPHTFSARHGRTWLYGTSIAWEWLIVAFIAWGVRGRVRLRHLIRRSSVDGPVSSVAGDIVWGVMAWIAISIVLSMVATTFGMVHGNQIAEVKEKLGFLIPRDAVELRWFLALSATAAFCEEVIFRGYLQRQMSAWTGNATLGVLLQAAVFGIGHAYEGRERMLLIFLYGGLLGIVAEARRNLRAGMLAHFLQDGITGVVLYRLLR